ncbi:MAG: ATP-dependent sacrificial sulfur transferase LarE [Actinomycetota bacterium]|nr:ATP-dependent sacrificial sulfur transferase LarE [Actinomycetota bacterium]
MPPLVVGFDLDLTLLDSRAGIAVVMAALSAETGVFINPSVVTSRLGPPVETELSAWFPVEGVAAAAERYRALYPDLAVAGAPLLPGARDAVAAVHRHGGRVLVVTGKHEPNARLHLEHLGLEVDAVAGGRFGVAKAEVLAAEEAAIYVGDHPADVGAARAAGADSVAVATGGTSAAQLTAAGADVVLADLTAFPAWLDAYVLDRRLDALDASLRSLGSVLVAYSGGADSAFLLAAAVRALGADRVVAATAVSDSLAGQELAPAARFARELGVRHRTPRTQEMAREGYRANAGDRCWFCKAELLDVLGPLAAELGLAAVATGTNADDAVAGFRPGIRAAAERGAVAPLRDAVLTKAQVRAASRRWGLPTWDKPAAACLSSRIAYGVRITPYRLARVNRAEAGLRAALAAQGVPVGNLRVRDLGDRARVEVDAEHVGAVGERAVAAVRDAGFDAVEVDARGFRSGAMNELLADPASYR